LFDHMFDVLAWGVAVSVFVILLAFLAEGRGAYAMSILLGVTRHEGGLHLYQTMAHDDSDWQVLSQLAESDRRAGGLAAREPAGTARTAVTAATAATAVH